MVKKPRRLVIPAALLLALGAGAAYSLNPFGFGGGGAGIDADDREKVALGARIYAENCASCHGAELEGEADWRQRRADGRLPAPPHDASGHTWHHPPDQLFAITKHGPAALAGGGYQSDMPAYEGVLSDDEIWAVLSYIKSRWPETIRERYDSMTQH